jgi:hypothetical protein
MPDARHRATTAVEGTPVVGAIEDGISRLSTFGNVVALVAGGALLAWVIGLLIVLRGTEPDERSEIIHAYAHCNPLVYLRRNTAPQGGGSALAHAKGPAADSDGETDHEGSA